MTQEEVTLKILSPEGTVFEGGVQAVFLPGTAGAFEVLPSHAPIVTTLAPGKIEWRIAGKMHSVAVLKGAAILDKNILTICAQTVAE